MFKSKCTKLKLSVKVKNAKLLNIGLMFVYLDVPWNRVDARRSKIWLTIEAKMMAMELSMTLVWR